MSSQLEKGLKEQKINRKKWMFIITGLLIAILLAATAVFFAFNSFNKETKEALGLPAQKKVNILLLGIDKRRNDIGRSNVTCVVTIDPDTKSVSMLWVPRDSRVRIPGNDWNKIGHAYAYDGPKLSEKTVSDLLGIPIDYYVSINMDGFKKVIDALGGVDINVDKRMYYYDPYDEGELATNNGLIDLKPGLQHMDGETALQYVRFRHDEMGDIGRIERQQKFAKALLADVINPSVITKIPSVVKEANSVFETDMPATEMLSLVKVVVDAYKQGLNTEMVSGKPVYIDGVSYWLPNIMEMRKQVARIQGISLDDNAARKLANEYEAAISQVKTTDDADSPATSVASNSNKQTTATSKVSNTNSTNNNLKKDTTTGPNSNAPQISQNNTVSTGPEPSNGTIRKDSVANTNNKSSKQ